MSRYGGDYPPRGPERWDRSRFEAASRGPPVVERERYEEVDYYPRARDRSAEPYRPPPTRGPIYKEEERYDYPYRAPRPAPSRYYEEERDPYEGAMVHRPREDRDFEVDIRTREVDRYPEPERQRYEAPPRPRFVRRQSSLDFHDRKPMARYGDRIQEETVMIPARRRRSPPRYRSPPRFQEPEIEERDYEDIRVSEPDYYGDQYYRGYRERETTRVRKKREVEEEDGGEEEIEEEDEEDVDEEKEYPRRGKTRMPLRLVEKEAVIELGYPFEEQDGTLIILRALGKEQIDEVIRRSKEIKNAPPTLEEKRTTYVFERTSPSPGPEPKVVERRTEVIREGSPSSEVPRSVREWDQMAMSKKSGKARSRHDSSGSSEHTEHASHHSRRRSSHQNRARSVSSAATNKHEIILTEDREESATIRGGINALVVPTRERQSSRSIQREIKALEAEKRALQMERDAESLRGEGSGGELIITRDRRDDAVEVRKDKKAPDPKIIRAMLATLT